MNTRWMVLVAAVIAVLLGGCGDDDSLGEASSSESGSSVEAPVPTEEAATQLLEEAHGFAAAGDIDALCSMSSAPENCHSALAATGEPPEGTPDVVATRVMAATGSDQSGSLATRVLGVCVAGMYSEVMVIATGAGTAELMTPVYWSGMLALPGGETHEGGTAGSEIRGGSPSAVICPE